MTSLVRRCHPERSEAQSRDPAELPDRFTGFLDSLGMAWIILLHQLQHRRSHSDHPGSNSRFGNGCEFTRMQGRQFLPRLFELRDLRRIDCAEVKINRRNGMIRQAVFGKIFTAHRGIDDLDVFVA